MSNSNLGFEVVDRRGERREKEPEAEPIKPSKQEWRGKGFMFVMVGTPDGSQLLAVRAAGTRSSDGQTFVADYLLPVVPPKNMALFEEVSKRLDTFLDCGCAMRSRCGVHDLYLRQWMEADYRRLALANAQPLPESLETLMRAERAREPKIVAPGR